MTMLTSADPIQNPVTSPIAPTFDLGRVRCAAEVALWSTIEKNGEFHERLLKTAAERESAFTRGKLSLITDAYRVDPAITPKIAELCEMLKSTLRVVQPIDVYVKASPEPNAFCVASRKGTRLVVCLSSSLFDLMTPHELLFVMGHEVAHSVYGHTRVPKLDFDEPGFSPLEVVRIRALGRRQEISCDRIGLLACQDVRVAGSALFKIMSGLPDRWLEFDELAYSKHFDQIGEMADVAPMDDAVSTHPIIALRVKALVSFAQSRLYTEGLGKPAAAQANEDFEKATEHMLSMLEPDLTELESASEQDAGNRFLLRGALVVAIADRALQPEEAKYLTLKMTLSPEMVTALKRPDFVEVSLGEIAKDAVILSHKLSMERRAGLLCELCRVALAAGGYATAEQEALIQIAKMLNIPPGLFQRVVEGTQDEVIAEAASAKPVKPRTRKRKRKAIVASEGSTEASGVRAPSGEVEAGPPGVVQGASQPADKTPPEPGPNV